MTIVVENNIAELKRFRDEQNIDTVLFTGLEGFLKFITINSKIITTVVLDSCVDPDKIPIIAQYINSMFPHITTVDYCMYNEKHSWFTHSMLKPFDESGRTLLKTLSGRAA